MFGKQTSAHSSVLIVLQKTGLNTADTGIFKDMKNGLLTLKQVIRVILRYLM